MVAFGARAVVAQQLEIDTVLVGNLNNPADSTGFGSVSYTYAISRTEITLAQYAFFLNAVAAVDTYGLYNNLLNTNDNIRGINMGGPGPVGFQAVGPSTHPVTYVSWFDAARFANWMANGQGVGPQNAAFTEDGAYTLNGRTSGAPVPKNAINPNTGQAPTWWIPSENEWYKAAYYDDSIDGYWQYPTRSNTAPGNVVGSTANQANYFDGRFSKTQSDTYELTQNYLTPGGAFVNSASYYGTFDQGGNVWEWTDGVSGTSNVIRGGSWDSTGYVFGLNSLQSSFSDLFAPSGESPDVGFRLATIPEPSAILLLGIAALVFTALRRQLHARRRVNG